MHTTTRSIAAVSGAALLLGLVLLLGSGAVAPTQARAELLESVELNYEIEVPNGWARLPHQGSWTKFGIVVGAERLPDTVKMEGASKPAKGEGGQLHLSIIDAPEGRSLDNLAADPEVLGFLLKRFADKPESWPERTTDSATYDDGLEVRIISTDGTAPNLKGRKSPTRGLMVLALARGKFYKLRLYAWHTEFDEEGLKNDLDSIEMSFTIPNLEPLKEAEGERPPPADGDEPEAAMEGDEGVEKVFEDKQVGWKVTKPVGIKSSDSYDKEKYKDVVVWFEDSSNVGSYQIIFYVIKRGRRGNAGNIPDEQLKPWGLDKWWKSFHEYHPDGPIRTFKWPRKSKSFITLPDFEKEKVVFATPKKRPKDPEKVNGSDLIKKYKVAEKVKNQKLGSEKTIEAYRGVLAGNLERWGREKVMRYIWGTSRLTCFISISMTKDAPMKWGDKVRELLESVEMTDPKAR